MKKALIAAVIGLGAVLTLQAQDGEGPGGPGGPGRGPGGGPGGGCPEVRQTHEATRRAAREHFRAQIQEDREFHESLRDAAPEQRIGMIIEHRQAQYQENTAFMQQQYEAMVAAITGCDTIPAERKQEILTRIQEHHREATAFRAAIHREVMQFLRDLQASDAPLEEKLASWRNFEEQVRERIRAWHQEHRPGGPDGQGPGRGPRGGGRGPHGRGPGGNRPGGGAAPDTP